MEKILRTFYTILLSLIGLVAFAEGDSHSLNDNINTADTKSYASVDEAKSMIENIIAVVGLKPKFELREANIPNAAAVIFNSKRYILYNPSFVTALNRAAGNKWASVSILAHEIGHHLNGHTLENGGSHPAIELEADEFSGFVLKKMGASLQEAQVAMKIAASQKESHTHPAQGDRLYAIAKGWNSASNQMNGTSIDVAKIYKQPEAERPVARQAQPQIQTQVVRHQQSTLADKYILKDVKFYNDKNRNYFVTTGSHLVRVDEDGLAVLGKLVAYEDERFPLLIVDAKKNYWMISQNGKIITPTGREIGYISNHR